VRALPVQAGRRRCPPLRCRAHRDVMIHAITRSTLSRMQPNDANRAVHGSGPLLHCGGWLIAAARGLRSGWKFVCLTDGRKTRPRVSAAPVIAVGCCVIRADGEALEAGSVSQRRAASVVGRAALRASESERCVRGAAAPSYIVPCAPRSIGALGLPVLADTCSVRVRGGLCDAWSPDDVETILQC
jgi:hypothetical protein